MGAQFFCLTHLAVVLWRGHFPAGSPWERQPVSHVIGNLSLPGEEGATPTITDCLGSHLLWKDPAVSGGELS